MEGFVSDISIKTIEALGYISVAGSLDISSTTFIQCAPKSTGFPEITRFRDIAFDRSKIVIFLVRLLGLTPRSEGLIPLGRSP